MNLVRIFFPANNTPMVSLQTALVIVLVIVLLAAVIIYSGKIVLEDLSANDFAGVWSITHLIRPMPDGPTSDTPSIMTLMAEISKDMYVDCSMLVYKFTMNRDGSGTGSIHLSAAGKPGTPGAQLYKGTVSLVKSIKTIHWTPVANPPPVPPNVSITPMIYKQLQ